QFHLGRPAPEVRDGVLQPLALGAPVVVVEESKNAVNHLLLVRSQRSAAIAKGTFGPPPGVARFTWLPLWPQPYGVSHGVHHRQTSCQRLEILGRLLHVVTIVPSRLVVEQLSHFFAGRGY